MVFGITIQSRAARKIAEITRYKTGVEALRIRVLGAKGPALKVQFDLDIPRPEDPVVEKDGAKVLIDSRSLLYLRGMELDFKEESTESGFTLEHPSGEKASECDATFPYLYGAAPTIPNIW